MDAIWTAEKDGDEILCGKTLVARVHGTPKEAAFIAKACNAYPLFVRALKSIASISESYDDNEARVIAKHLALNALINGDKA